MARCGKCDYFKYDDEPDEDGYQNPKGTCTKIGRTVYDDDDPITDDPRCEEYEEPEEDEEE